jgi:hypothetical protein
MVVPRQTDPVRGRPIAIVIGILMGVETVAFVGAATIHFGIGIVLGPLRLDDPFPGAAIPEAIIAGVLGIGVLSVLARWPARWGVALATTLFALLVTIYGLTVTVGSARTGDILYHIGVLGLAGVIVGLLLLPAGRHGLSG